MESRYVVMRETSELLELGKRLRRYREMRKMTQASLAEAAGLDPRYYNRVENGHLNVTYLTLIKIMRALGEGYCPGGILPGVLLASPEMENVCRRVSHLASGRDKTSVRKLSLLLSEVLGAECVCAAPHCPACFDEKGVSRRAR